MKTSTLLIAPFTLCSLHLALADKIGMATEDTLACDSKDGEVTSLLQVEVARSSAKEVASISASAAGPRQPTLLQKAESVSRAAGEDRKALKVHPLDGQWVLPYLYLTSAISWMISSKSAGPYIWRLSIVLAVGVGANLVADVVTGRNWKGDFGNTIFQMFYVVMLMAMSVLTGPLRQALLSRKNLPESKAACGQVAALVGYGSITLLALVLFVYQKQGEALVHIPQSSWFNNLRPVINDFPVTLIQICGALFLSHVACLFKANDVFPWFLLVHIFLPRIFVPWYQVGFIHNLELFVWGMVAESWGLRGKATITKVVQNYWPIMAFSLMMATMPDMFGRCDLMPASTVLERIRFYGIEVALCLVLVTGSLQFGDPYNCIEWLSYWALYAYCFHVAWARLLPVPYGALVTYGSAILVYFAWRLFSTNKGSAAGLAAPAAGFPTPGSVIKQDPDAAGG